MEKDAAQCRQGALLPSIGVLRGGITAPAVTSQIHPNEKFFTDFW